MKNIAIFILGLALISSGCSDDGATDKDTGVTADLLLPDTLSPDSGVAKCGAGIYPCGPYGANKGDIAENMEFLGFVDPGHACKEHKDKTLDTSKLVKLSFKDFHLGDSTCPQSKKELLWVMVSAGWCSPCKTEVSSTNSQYVKNALDKRVDVINILFETDSPVKPATQDYLKVWIKDRGGVKFPVVMDPSFKMGKYFPKSAVPFNMLIDTKTGKIFYRQTGGSLANIGKKISEFFQ